MRLNVQKDAYEREFDWEINLWHLDDPDVPIDSYSLWHDKGAIVIASSDDLYEHHQFDTVEELNELIERLIKARKDVFGV